MFGPDAENQKCTQKVSSDFMNIGLNNFATFPCFPLAFTRAKYPANDDETDLRLIKKYHRKPCESGHRSALPGLQGNRLEARASQGYRGCLESSHSLDRPRNHSFQEEGKVRTRWRCRQHTTWRRSRPPLDVHRPLLVLLKRALRVDVK